MNLMHLYVAIDIAVWQSIKHLWSWQDNIV